MAASIPGYSIGCLQFDEEPALAAKRGNRLAERRHARAGELRVEPFACVQAADFRQREVGQRPLTLCLALDDHLPATVGEDLFDVGRALECQVVQDHQRAVLRALQVELHERRVLLGGQGERRHGVLGCVR